MATEDLNGLELYFFGPPAAGLAAKHYVVLNGFVEENAGPGWLQRLETVVSAYRAAVDQEIRETADITRVLGETIAQLSRIPPWRRAMEKVAFSCKSPAERSALLKAAGYGLGQVRSVKDAKEFLLQVKSLVAGSTPSLRKRGVAPEVLDFPARTLPLLEGASDTIATEKAEATLARNETRRQEEALRALLGFVEDGLGVMVAQCTFLTDPSAKQVAEEIHTHWITGMAEANVQSQHRATEGGVPPGLLDPPAPAPAPTPDGPTE